MTEPYGLSPSRTTPNPADRKGIALMRYTAVMYAVALTLLVIFLFLLIINVLGGNTATVFA